MHKRMMIISLLALSFFLAGCSRQEPAATPAVELPTLAAVPTEAPPTTVPPATRVLLVTGNQLPATDVNLVTARVQEFASASGLTLETLGSITPENLAADVKIAIILPPDPGIADLAAGFPGIRFISIGIPGVQPSANLSVVAPDGSHPEWAGFMAGYIAAVITDEWRVGMLSQAGNTGSNLAADAFINGAEFYCGLCQKTYPPFYYIAPVLEVNPTTNQVEWQPWADQFIQTPVRTGYVYHGVSNPELLAYLAQNGLMLIGSEAPPENLRQSWVATLRTDLVSPLQQAWQDSLAGAPGSTYPAAMGIYDINENLITPGKLRLINETMVLLAEGAISPNTIP